MSADEDGRAHRGPVGDDSHGGRAGGRPDNRQGGTQDSRAEAFRALHHGERPLLLPNAWDHASAAALHRRGFPAIGTTSLGVAAAAGLPDGAGAARDETLALARGLARLPVPVSVDIGGGFSDDPGEVAALGVELERAGVAGVNIEDGRPDGTLADPARQTAKITALKEAAPGLFVNARTDTHWLGVDATLTGALHRCSAYAAAGADCLFVPGMVEHGEIAALAGELAPAPLNVLFSPAHCSYGELAGAGVARVSLGSLLFRTALRNAVDLACSIAEPDELPAAASPLPPSWSPSLPSSWSPSWSPSLPSSSPVPVPVPGYAEVQGLHEEFRPRR
ncbi:isocitrate lyase/PEP mutase family protein [Streptomyces marispadix]|uniref:Isocitrate lyase/phosphoenolpyruvate mutase family protein n=1 Tax=Streptomyces marispadix TaxID=2922868 RepID=A0ABS9T3P6_9ACTN|nr:isocitrate lyase/phosphoenolpyruvate mutase family protein [Streptomyces marispadix]MCH6163164.1 isocitrate lyase/phosphoenolpyruvate mutase family protein [Streptomyces marispadix]